MKRRGNPELTEWVLSCMRTPTLVGFWVQVVGYHFVVLVLLGRTWVFHELLLILGAALCVFDVALLWCWIREALGPRCLPPGDTRRRRLLTRWLVGNGLALLLAAPPGYQAFVRAGNNVVLFLEGM